MDSPQSTSTRHPARNLAFMKDAWKDLPRLFALVDKNRFSPTYGCFDRNFWHYKTIDFPSGMPQLGVLAFAYAYAEDFAELKGEEIVNPWYHNERVKELAIAGMRYLPKCSHADGSADEFYPFERALGATAFPLIAATEAFLVLKLDAKARECQDIVSFFRKRASWLIENIEPAAIANHLAGAALAIANVYLITGERVFLEGARKKMRETIAHMHPEGWFQEYDGCDVGYLTFTIDYIAKYALKMRDRSSLATLKHALSFASHFVHPDGSFAGEYGSRNTGHFLPAGFEILASRLNMPLARSMLERVEDGLREGVHERMDDEKYFFYNLNNYLQAYIYARDAPRKLGAKLPVLPCDGPDFHQYFPIAKLLVRKQRDVYLVMNVGKGGVMKVFKGNRLAYSFTGFIGKTAKGDVVATQLYGGIADESIGEDEVRIQGRFQKAFFKLQTTDKFLALRGIMLTFGRSWAFGSRIKRLLVKMLITKKKVLDKQYEIVLRFSQGHISMSATLDQQHDQCMELYETADLALIQVPTSRYYAESNLSGWKQIPVSGTKDVKVARKIS